MDVYLGAQGGSVNLPRRSPPERSARHTWVMKKKEYEASILWLHSMWWSSFGGTFNTSLPLLRLCHSLLAITKPAFWLCSAPPRHLQKPQDSAPCAVLHGDYIDLMCWSIWMAQNDFIFRNIQPSSQKWRATFKKEFALVIHRAKKYFPQKLIEQWLEPSCNSFDFLYFLLCFLIALVYNSSSLLSRYNQ